MTTFDEDFQKAMQAAAKPAEGYTTIAIGALQKNVQSLVKKLGKYGIKCEVDDFRSGPGGAQHYGPSYVEVSASGPLPDNDEAYSTVKFLAGGYTANRSGEIGGEDWRTMSAKGFAFIIRELQRQGWKPPIKD